MLIADPPGPPIDLNFFCCNGTVGFAVVTVGEKTDHERIAYFTTAGQRITSIMQERSHRRDWLPLDFAVPEGYAEAARAAAELSGGIDFVRVDIIVANGQPYACGVSAFPGEAGYDTTALFKSWDIRRTWFVNQPRRGFLESYRQALARRLDADQARPVIT